MRHINIFCFVLVSYWVLSPINIRFIVLNRTIFPLQNIGHPLIGFLSDILAILELEAVLFVWSASDSIAGR